MLTGQVLGDGVIELRCLQPAEAGPAYLGWLHDPEVNRYLEVRHALPQQLADLQAFVESVNQSPDSILFGIFLVNGPHVGNVKLGPVNALHRRADVGIILGDKGQWGRGLASRAIRLISAYAFDQLALQRLSAGCYDSNQGSLRAFVKAGYQHEGTLAGYWQCDGQSVGQMLMGLSAGAQLDSGRQVNFGTVPSLVFIGGGHLMLRTLLAARNRGLRAGAILAQRHADEVLPGGQTLLASLRSQSFSVDLAESADDVDPARLGEGFAGALALCFGPAWVFPPQVLARFAAGMLNFNGIPIPRYLGGAHYTWQILNGHRQAGCHIQCITDDVDQGDLLLSEAFALPASVRTPEDYFRENDRFGLQFLGGFLDRLAAGQDFVARAFANVNGERLYFPRLMTRDNGWIDWSWSGDEIEAFCRAFGPPYRGASTQYNGQRLFISQATLLTDPSHPTFHPFCAGLIVRKTAASFCVAVRQGLLRIDACKFDDGSATSSIREGDRLFTDAHTLAQARLHRPRLAGSSK